MNCDFWQVLPWLANGTLNGEERARVEATLENRADLRSNFEWELMLREAVKTEEAQWSPPAGALDEVLRRIDRSAKPAQRAGVKDFFARLFAPGLSSPQLAVACAVVVVQFGVIGTLLRELGEDSDYAAFRSVQARPPSTQFLRVMFKPDIRESELRESLTSIGAEIVAGPSQIGDYYLLVDRERISIELSTLKANPKIASAEIVDALPGKP